MYKRIACVRVCTCTCAHIMEWRGQTVAQIRNFTPHPIDKWNIQIRPCHCEEQRMLRRGNLAERNAPDGWIPTLSLWMTKWWDTHTRKHKVRHPPTCHVERSETQSKHLLERKRHSLTKNNSVWSPVPMCHPEARSAVRISWKGNDVYCRKYSAQQSDSSVSFRGNGVTVGIQP